jgi:hypothetical protein
MLGPPVCIECEIVADYHPNEENPSRQGDWICPCCGDNFTSGPEGLRERDKPLFLWSEDEQIMIALATMINRENNETREKHTDA